MDGRCGKCGRELEAGASISVTGVGERCYGCLSHGG
jgi:bacterioferritin-associated ferredoxin